MGIRPQSGTPVETNYRVNGSTEAQQLITDAEHTGNEAGKVFAEVAAQADSANKSAKELSSRVRTLETQLKAIQTAAPEKYDYVSPNQLVVIQRRGEIVTMSARVTIPTGSTYTDINLPDWAKPIKFDFLQFPAAYQGTTGRGQIKKAEGVTRIFGAGGQTLAFSTSWCA
ncbi:hypothetical protein [Corynebacterium simulans]|uniref:hypothetical protein n=1 Tax=Corynebacterium simulans TaxID=146827 RepID=UPI0007867294|nr:hypothetical protein [Corynebacterium simulans]